MVLMVTNRGPYGELINFYLCALVIFAAAVCKTIYSLKVKSLQEFIYRENFPELLSASLIASESDIAYPNIGLNSMGV